jgi:hypothetical protein
MNAKSPSRFHTGAGRSMLSRRAYESAPTSCWRKVAVDLDVAQMVSSSL